MSLSRCWAFLVSLLLSGRVLYCPELGTFCSRHHCPCIRAPLWREFSCALIFLVYGVIGLLQVAGIIPASFLPYNDAMYSFVGAVLVSNPSIFALLLLPVILVLSFANHLFACCLISTLPIICNQFSFYLAYHTKLIVAGKHAKYQMSEKDYGKNSQKRTNMFRRFAARLLFVLHLTNIHIGLSFWSHDTLQRYHQHVHIYSAHYWRR